MSVSVSPHGFETVRGRGYRPEDVDRRVEGLSIDRDSCWERAARLTVLCNEMDAELAELQEYVAKLPPQTFESLGENALLMLRTAKSEAERLRAEAQVAAERIRDEAMEYADRVRDAAESASRELRAEAEESGRRTEEAARAEAAGLADEADEDAEQWRGEAAAVLTDMRHRTDQMWHEQERRQAEEWDAAGRELAVLEAETDRLVAELDERADALLAERRRLVAEVEEAARHCEEDADDRAVAIVAQARVEAERIERTTARVLREHEEERAEVRAHMAHVRNSLAALTGKDPEGLEDGTETEPETEPETRPEPEPGAAADGEGGGTGAGDSGDGGAESAAADAGTRDPDGCDPDNEDTLETELPRLDGPLDEPADSRVDGRVEG
ncbi:cellulose-binding protein [Streptomyces chattanoogensis]|uniref:cellulose-binding protein n=1 Tax=Streptomyces chattanoogensis TaxID=66876 RepID=UPI0036805A69